MSAEAVTETIRQALMLAFWVSVPLLAIGFLAGVVISLVQVLTSMQDAAVATVPRLAAFLAALLISLPWMLRQLLTYTSALFGDFSRYAR